MANGIGKGKHQSDCMEVNQLPGPRGLPLFRNLLHLSPTNFHSVAEKWSDEYGSLFKIKLGHIPVVVSTDPEAIQFVLKNRPEKFRRHAKLDEVIRELGVFGVFNAEGDEWKRQRKLVSEALNLNHLKTFFPILAGTTGRLLTHWNAFSSKNSNVEIKSEMTRYTVDVTSQLAFGYDMNTLEKIMTASRIILKLYSRLCLNVLTFPSPTGDILNWLQIKS